MSIRGVFSGPSLDQVCGDRDNNFNLIRMTAAVAVLVSHAYPITLGSANLETILRPVIGLSLGWTAVAVFFVISGFLIARSFDTKSHIIDWSVARFMRIFPGLFVVVLLTVLVLGPLVTTLSPREYFSDPGVTIYFLRNITLASIQYDLPGVFKTLPHTGEVNSSLWTLIHEVACYMGVLVAGLFGLLRKRRLMAVALAGYLLLYMVIGWPLVEEHLLQKFTALRDLSFPFAVGMALYVWRDKVLLNWWICLGLGGVVALLFGTPVFKQAFLVWLSYTVFVLAYLPGGGVRKYNLLGDYSYGFYIYAFPVQQLAVYLFGAMTPLQNILISIPATLFFAVLSWVWIEKPALAARHRVASAVQKWRGLGSRKSGLEPPSQGMVKDSEPSPLPVATTTLSTTGGSLDRPSPGASGTDLRSVGVKRDKGQV